MKHLTSKDFDLIKTLQGAGVSQTRAAEITKRGQGTISYCYRFSTIEEYRDFIKQMNLKRLSEPQPAQTTPEETPPDTESGLQVLMDIREILREMLLMEQRKEASRTAYYERKKNFFNFINKDKREDL